MGQVYNINMQFLIFAGLSLLSVSILYYFFFVKGAPPQEPDNKREE